VVFSIRLRLTKVPLTELAGVEEEISAHGVRAGRGRAERELTCRATKHEEVCPAR